jgi:hypothetical protein
MPSPGKPFVAINRVSLPRYSDRQVEEMTAIFGIQSARRNT